MSYRCSLCFCDYQPPLYTIGVLPRIVCLDCWRRTFNISICWRCSEFVFRKTDAIAFGWCWWHWSCFGCLLCAVRHAAYGLWKTSADIEETPLQRPDYLDHQGRPHRHGIFVDRIPVCDRCSEEPESIERLEQHARVLHLPRDMPHDPESEEIVQKLLLSDLSEAGYNTLLGPVLIPETGIATPAWFDLLPSNVNPHINPPRHSILQRRSTFPFFESTRYSTPLPEYPGSSSAETPTGDQVTTPQHRPNTPFVNQRSKSFPAHNSFGFRKATCSYPESSAEGSFRKAEPAKNNAVLASRCLPGESLPTKPYLCLERLPQYENVLPASGAFDDALHTSIDDPNLTSNTGAVSPLVKELSDLFSDRIGKHVLPSRIINFRDSAVNDTKPNSAEIRAGSTNIPSDSSPSTASPALCTIPVEKKCVACGGKISTPVAGSTSAVNHPKLTNHCPLYYPSHGPEGKLCLTCKRRESVVSMQNACVSMMVLDELLEVDEKLTC